MFLLNLTFKNIFVNNGVSRVTYDFMLLTAYKEQLDGINLITIANKLSDDDNDKRKLFF